MKPKRTWIVIADGARAHVVLSQGPGKSLLPIKDLIFAGDHSPARDVMADRPGRTFDSEGKGRHAMEYGSDPHQNLKVRFIKELSNLLAKRVSEYDRIVLVAPPPALGIFRKCLSKVVAKKVSAELGKDLTHLPIEELPDHLEAASAL